MSAPATRIVTRSRALLDRVSSATPWGTRIKEFMIELQGVRQFAPASMVRFCVDALVYRWLRLFPSYASDRTHTVRLRDGTRLTYRRNRGDIQSVREVWLTPTYEPPFPTTGFDVVVDLGANIGLTTLFFARRYGAQTCVAVEPDPDNARLLRRNLAQNDVRAIVLEAAVGREDGTAWFARTHESNLGHITSAGGGGISVPVVSMPTVLAALDADRVAMLKIDIEGGESELFAGATGWLDSVDALMMELHSAIVATAPVIARITSHGFRHIPVDSIRQGTTDAFVR